MEFTSNQKLYFNTDKHLTLSELVDTLSGLDKILKKIPSVLHFIDPGITLDTQVSFDKIESGSLFEEVVIKGVFGSQKKFDDFLTDVHKATGLGILMNSKYRQKLIQGVLLALLLYGGYLAYKTINNDEKGATDIHAEYSTVINITADSVNLSPEFLDSCLKNAVKSDRAGVARAAVKALKPAKKTAGSTLTINDDQDARIPSSILRIIPSDLPSGDLNPPMRSFESVLINIRATDYESRKSGWKVRVPELFNKKVPMLLSELVCLQDLEGKTELKGHVTVIYKPDVLDQDGKQIPVRIILDELLTND